MPIVWRVWLPPATDIAAAVDIDRTIIACSYIILSIDLHNIA